MRVLRIITVALFAAVFCVFAWFFIDAKLNTDTTLPQIYIEGDLLDVSIHDGEEALLQGVSAYDKKDGDITSEIIVESVSSFVEDGICNVTYAVADNDKHVTKNTRMIRYTDYTSPKFSLSKSVVFSVSQSLDVRSVIGVEDIIDGDISEKLIVTASDFKASTAGAFTVSVQATNSKGDTVYLDLPIFVEQARVRAPQIQLRDYLIYVDKGSEPDFRSYIASVTSDYNAVDESSLVISEDYDPGTPGVYSIHYYVLDAQGYEGHAVLTVVVEE